MRVFAGLALSDNIVRLIDRWCQSWAERQRGLKPVKPESLHVTLFFFGEKNKQDIGNLITALDRLHLKMIEASLGDISCFPNAAKPKVYYLGIAKGGGRVISLYESFMETILPLGYRKDTKGFTPHITFARSKKREPAVSLPGYGQINGKDFILDRLILFESRLKPDGAEYFPLKTVPFE